MAVRTRRRGRGAHQVRVPSRIPISSTTRTRTRTTTATARDRPSRPVSVGSRWHGGRAKEVSPHAICAKILIPRARGKKKKSLLRRLCIIVYRCVSPPTAPTAITPREKPNHSARLLFPCTHTSGALASVFRAAAPILPLCFTGNYVEEARTHPGLCYGHLPTIMYLSLPPPSTLSRPPQQLSLQHFSPVAGSDPVRSSSPSPKKHPKKNQKKKTIPPGPPLNIVAPLLPRSRRASPPSSSR